MKISKEKQIIEKVKTLEKGEFDKIPEPFLSQYNNFLKDKYGKEVVAVGRNLLQYLFDVIKKDVKKGIECLINQ